jgi:putative redox protein
MIVVEAQIGTDHYKTLLKSGVHTVIGDEPIPDGGTDLGLAPYQFVLTGLAACKVMTVRFYADREQWPLTSVEARLEMEVKREGSQTISEIIAILTFQGDLSQSQKDKLLLIADKCPVHKMLMGDFVIQSRFAL